MIRSLQSIFSRNAREKRGKLFFQKFPTESSLSLLDLGGGNGSHINQILKGMSLSNVTISDISTSALEFAKKEYGYKISRLTEDDVLPFSDNQFDIVFCNSVIEHVTLPKKDIWSHMNSEEFTKLSYKRQKKFADEIRRVCKGYFVQTPNKYFIIESHTWLPGFIVFFPRKILIKVIKLFNLFWPKKTTPDWNLLTYNEMKQLFPEAIIYREKSFGLTKSFIAIKTLKNNQG